MSDIKRCAGCMNVYQIVKTDCSLEVRIFLLIVGLRYVITFASDIVKKRLGGGDRKSSK